MQPLLDAQLVADEIAVSLENLGSLKFKVIAYKMLQAIIRSGALGAEIVLSGKLPSERARSWRFAEGYLKKTGDTAKVVDRAMSQAKTMPGVVGIKVSILAPDAVIHDRIVVDAVLLSKLKLSDGELKVEEKIEDKPKKSKSKKKSGGSE